MSDQAQQHAEEFRSLAADFQETFGTPSGQRVYAHLMDKVLMAKTPSVIWSSNGAIFPNADKGVYFTALSDVAKAINYMLNYDFTRMRQRPVVHTRRPS